MLCNAEIITAIGTTLRKYYPATGSSVPNLVVDPVMIASSGAALLDTSSIESLIQEILPLCFILTPNVPEAEYILSKAQLDNPLFTSQNGKIDSLDQMKAAAQDLARLGPSIVLLKGGHLPFYKSSGKALPHELFNSLDDFSVEMEELELIDLIWDSRSKEFTELRKDFLRTSSTHGTGCTLSAAIAAYLSRGHEGKKESETENIHWNQCQKARTDIKMYMLLLFVVLSSRCHCQGRGVCSVCYQGWIDCWSWKRMLKSLPPCGA
jgi:hydroxymethylpyrimidine/phosphomethylpyrimidine kinase